MIVRKILGDKSVSYWRIILPWIRYINLYVFEFELIFTHDLLLLQLYSTKIYRYIFSTTQDNSFNYTYMHRQVVLCSDNLSLRLIQVCHIITSAL